MSLTLVVYAPGTGGNHLKNLLCLADSYANSSDLTPDVYESPDPQRPPGEVWCVGGRNLQDIFFDRMVHTPEKHWVLAAHFGEMCQYQQNLAQVINKKIVVITLNNQQSRRVLDQRQQRLGQCIHPYWLDEELVHVYCTETLCRLFDLDQSHCLQLPIQYFWSKNFVKSDTFEQLTDFLNIDVCINTAHRFHQLWTDANNFM